MQETERQLTAARGTSEIFNWDLVINIKNGQADTQQHFLPNIFIVVESSNDQTGHSLAHPALYPASKSQQLRGC